MPAALRCLCVFVLLLTSTLAHADVLASYQTDAHALDVLIAKEAKTGKVPRLVDADAGPLLTRLTDAGQLAGPYSAKQIDALTKVCYQAQRLRAAYVDAGFSNEALAKVNHAAYGKVDADLQARMLDNTNRFQDEIVRIEGFEMHCVVALMDALNPFAAKTDLASNTRAKDYLVGMRSAADIEMIGLLGLLRNPFWSADNKERLFQTLDVTGKPATLAMPPEWQANLVQQARAIQTRLSAADAHRIDSYVLAVSNQPCSPLCKAPLLKTK